MVTIGGNRENCAVKLVFGSCFFESLNSVKRHSWSQMFRVTDFPLEFWEIASI